MPPAAWCGRRRGCAPRGAGARASPAALAEERTEVAQHLVRVEADAHVLHPEDAGAVDERSEERVVDVAALHLPREHAVALGDLLDLRRRPGEERPARPTRAVRLGVAPQDVRGVALWIDG